MKCISATKSYSYLIFDGFLTFFVVAKLEKTGQCFQVSVHFHPLHPWPQTTKNSFSALQLTIIIVNKTTAICLVFVDAKTSFSVFIPLRKVKKISELHKQVDLSQVLLLCYYCIVFFFSSGSSLFACK